MHAVWKIIYLMCENTEVKVRQCGMLFAKSYMYIYCVKVHRGKGEGEAMWHAF